MLELFLHDEFCGIEQLDQENLILESLLLLLQLKMVVNLSVLHDFIYDQIDFLVLNVELEHILHEEYIDDVLHVKIWKRKIFLFLIQILIEYFILIQLNLKMFLSILQSE
jgi:hypothetical protein